MSPLSVPHGRGLSLGLREVGLAMPDGTHLRGLTHRFGPGVHRVVGPRSVVAGLGRLLTHERLAEPLRTWGEVTVDGLDHRVCPPIARVKPPPRGRSSRGPLTVRASTLTALPPDTALEVLSIDSEADRRRRADELVRHLLEEMGLDLDLEAEVASLSPSRQAQLAMSHALARGSRGTWIEVEALAEVDRGAMDGFLRQAANTRVLLVAGPLTAREPVDPSTVLDLAPHLGEGAAPPSPPRWFRWIRWGLLGGMSRPGATAPADEVRSWLTATGVDRVVGLEETSFAEALRGCTVTYEHFPIVDMDVPALPATLALLDRIADERVVFHCKAGLGRTGMLLGAHLVLGGYRATQALTLLRRIEPHYVQTRSQEAFLERVEEARWTK